MNQIIPDPRAWSGATSFQMLEPEMEPNILDAWGCNEHETCIGLMHKI